MMTILKKWIGILFLALVSLSFAVACGTSAKLTEKMIAETVSVSTMNEKSVIDSFASQRYESSSIIEKTLANTNEDLQVEIMRIEFETNSKIDSLNSSTPFRTITTYKINRKRKDLHSKDSNINTQLSETDDELILENEKEAITSDIKIKEKELRSVKKKVLIRSSYYSRHVSYV